MLIRKATIDDIDEILLMETLFVKPYTREQVRYEIEENPTSNILVAVKNDDLKFVCGFIDFWITFDSATICQIAVKKEFQNQGIASMLLNESYMILKANDVLFYTLEVREHNTNAVNLYLKHGFTKVTIKEQYYANGENAIYMMKGLN